MKTKLPFLLVLLFVVWSAGPAFPEHIWLDVPFVKQEGKGCGAAVISMVIRYWANHVEGLSAASADPERIMALLYSENAEGIYASDLQKYLQENRFKTFVFRGTWKDLQHHLKKGRPMIAALDMGDRGGPIHYVVVAGIDSAEQTVSLNDPAQRKLRRMSRSEFEKAWGAMEYWALLPVPDVQ